MKTETVTASNKESKGQALTDKAGKTITRKLRIPESMADIDTIFGSLEACVEKALKSEKIELQGEIRAEWEALHNGGGGGKTGSVRVSKIAR